MNSDPDSPEVRTAAGKSTVNWSGSRVGGLVSGEGDDTITGRADDYSDIWAGGGDDVIYVNDEDDLDDVSCYNGTDTVFYDAGDTVNQKDCEVLNPPVGG